MKEKAVFDEMAASYDSMFSLTRTGKEQRERVRHYLTSLVRPGMKILEINCGTGEDAFFLAGLGCDVTATDGSEEMIRQCLEKQSSVYPGSKVLFKKLEFHDLMTFRETSKFDMIFSNFSGLNCLGPGGLSDLSRVLGSMLGPEGKFVVVMFGSKCAWEWIYMILKGKFREAGRRKRTGPVVFKYQGKEQPVWYYSPGRLRKTIGDNFLIADLKPVGLFLPPTYLDNYFRTKNRVLSTLSKMERWVANSSVLSDWADHFFAEFRKA